MTWRCNGQHRQLAALLAQLNGQGLALDVLSMGMSATWRRPSRKAARWCGSAGDLSGSRPVKSQAG